MTVEIADLLEVSPIRQRLDDAVKSEVAQGFSGAVLVARGNEILLDRGYGKAGGMPVHANYPEKYRGKFTSAASATNALRADKVSWADVDILRKMWPVYARGISTYFEPAVRDGGQLRLALEGIADAASTDGQ